MLLARKPPIKAAKTRKIISLIKAICIIINKKLKVKI